MIVTDFLLVLGSTWPDIQGNTTDQSSLAIDSKLLYEHLTISRAWPLTPWTSQAVGRCSSWHWHTLESQGMEHYYSTTTIYCENGRTILYKAQNKQVHSELRTTLNRLKILNTFFLSVKHVIRWIVQLKCEPCTQSYHGVVCYGED